MPPPDPHILTLTQIVLACLAGFGTLVVFGLIIKFQQARITKLDEKKVDKEHCGQMETFVNQSLDRGEEKFNKIDKSIEDLKMSSNKQITALELMKKDIAYIVSDIKKRNGETES